MKSKTTSMKLAVIFLVAIAATVHLIAQDVAVSCGYVSFGVSLRALSGSSCGASEEVFVFRPLRCLKRKAKTRRRMFEWQG